MTKLGNRVCLSVAELDTKICQLIKSHHIWLKFAINIYSDNSNKSCNNRILRLPVWKGTGLRRQTSTFWPYDCPDQYLGGLNEHYIRMALQVFPLGSSQWDSEFAKLVPDKGDTVDEGCIDIVIENECSSTSFQTGTNSQCVNGSHTPLEQHHQQPGVLDSYEPTWEHSEEQE